MSQKNSHNTTTDTDRQPRIPTIGDDPRDAKEIADPRGKIWFRDLDEAVIEADRCIQCGTCEAACPSGSIGVDELDGRPTLVKMCTGCSLCWDFCPRSGMRYERANEIIQDRSGGRAQVTYAARAANEILQTHGQNGGAVTGLLARLLETGVIDGAVVAQEDPDKPLKGQSRLVTTKEELAETAGSVFTQMMQLGRVEELVAKSDLTDPDIALVGTPCVITGARSLQEFGRDSHLQHITLTIALMCTQSFEYEHLRSTLIDAGVRPSEVSSLSLVGDGLRIQTKSSETITIEVSGNDAPTMPGCDECADFVGKAADISAGTIGSQSGHSTLIARSDVGGEILRDCKKHLELTEIDTETAVNHLESWNKKQAESALSRDFDPEGELFIDYEEHRAAYDDTEREPQPHNPARCYQYERWC